LATPPLKMNAKLFASQLSTKN